MKIANISVNRPVGVIVIVIAVMILGFVSLTDLTIDLLPDIELPVAVVMTNYNGVAPQEIESLITSPIEGTVSTVEGLSSIQSISAPNQSVVLLLFDFGTDMNTAMLNIRDRVDFARQMIPDGAGDPTVLKFDPNTFPIMQLSFSGNAELAELTQIAQDTILPRIERLPGVAQVSLTGSETQVVNVEVDPLQMEAYHLNLMQLIQLIGSENINASAGNIERGNQSLSLRVTGEFENLEDIRSINIPLATGEMIKLKDLASVQESIEEPTSLAYVNRERTLSLDITKQSDANTVQVANLVQDELTLLQNELPERMNVNTIWDSSLFIREAIQNVVINMIIGAVMAILVLMLFLRSIRSTFVIAASIPIAIISAFTMIYFSGQTLNILTMGGLALGVGLMVDSSIVILENIFKYREKGFSLMESAKKGTAEVGSAVIAATLTSVVVFLPIVFTSGIASEIFMPLALTVTFTLIASLAVALTLVPMLASRLLPRHDELEKPIGRLKRFSLFVGEQVNNLNHGYRNALRWVIAHKKTIFFGTILLLVASFALLPLIGTEFLPLFDQGEILVEVEMPPGTSLQQTEDVLKKFEDFMLATPAVDIAYTSVGGDASGMQMRESADIGSIYVRLLPTRERDISTQDLIDEATQFGQDIPDAQIQITPLQSADIGEDPVSIRITGDNLDVLQTLSREIEEMIAPIDGLANISNSLDDTRSELQVHVDRDEASQHGLTYQEVMQTIQTSFQGQVSTFIRSEGQEIEVKVLLPQENRNTLENLSRLSIQTPLGDSIPLSSIADFEEVQGPSTINRRNQERGANIRADIFDRDLGSVIAEIEENLHAFHFPDGYNYTIGGQFEQMSDAFDDLTLALILAIFLVYAVMAIQFEKVMYPFIIMFSLPPTLIGILVGFAITGRPLSAPAFIGFIMLAGIVVNNAIVLVDYINTLRKRGMNREEAILQAGPDRLRPILMTMLTTVLAMIPLAIGLGEGAEMQAPLATVIVFGLSFSTIITLVFVPVVYIYIDDLTNWSKSLFTRNRA